MVNRRILLALGCLALAGCIDTPNDKPLPRTQSLLKRLGGTPAVERIADAFTDQVLLADDVSKGRKELLLGPDKANARKKLIAQLTDLGTGGPPPTEGPLVVSVKDAEAAAVKAAFVRALKACKVSARDEADLLKALEPQPAG
jgi:hypothetical protein